MDIEQIRESYLPDTIRVLLVGESPPKGGTFFYAANSNLFRYTKKTFERTLDRKWHSSTDFLEFFQKQGFFLCDLCLTPIDKVHSTERKRRSIASVQSLSQRIAEYAPESLLVTPKRIAPYVENALTLSGQKIAMTVLPFAGNGWQNVYMEQLAKFISRYRGLPQIHD